MSFGKKRMGLQSLYSTFFKKCDGNPDGVNSVEEEFKRRFFHQCSMDELYNLDNLAKSKSQCQKILVKFSIDKAGVNSDLSDEDMKNFVFSNHGWIAKFLTPRSDELLDQSSATLLIKFR